MSTSAPSRTLHYGLWAAQILLGLAYLGAGAMKATAPIADLHAQMNWTNHTPDALIRVIGVSEFAGALGLLLPSALRIQPILTPIAASALVAVMTLGFGFHAYLGEAAMGVPTLVLGSIAAFVAWGRFSKAPIQARSAVPQHSTGSAAGR